jgi:hypothetical protein
VGGPFWSVSREGQLMDRIVLMNLTNSGRIGGIQLTMRIIHISVLPCY